MTYEKTVKKIIEFFYIMYNLYVYFVLLYY